MAESLTESRQVESLHPAERSSSSHPRVEVLNWLLFIVVAVQAFMLVQLSQRVAALENLLAPPQPVLVERNPDERGFSTGNQNAPITLVEFADFECPACADAAPIVTVLLEKYPEQIRFVFRNFPLTSHPNAYLAAGAAECAGLQGKYWEMHATLFEYQDALELSHLLEYAGRTGLDLDDYEACLQSDEIRNVIDRDLADGKRYQVSGTPTFFVNQLRVTGLSGLEKAVEEALDQASR